MWIHTKRKATVVGWWLLSIIPYIGDAIWKWKATKVMLAHEEVEK